MRRAPRFPVRYRFLAAALAVSAALHAAVLLGLPGRIGAIDRTSSQVFSARLDEPPPAPVVSAPPPKPPRPKPHRHPRAARAHPAPKVAAVAKPPVPPLLTAAKPSGDVPAIPVPAPEPQPVERIATAEPILPWLPPPPALPVPPPPTFPMEALPEHLAIDYDLDSAILHAHAVYRWEREGDSYRITGEGAASGILQLFLDGEIRQESVGTITAAGLRPERFVERKSGHDDEGLEFDWPKHRVTFERGASRKTAPLADDTVDWLTMIFELASVPPRPQGETLALRVFTQRKLYDFHLKVLGVEEIEIPMGKVRALHLRHVDPDDGKDVDVWLGIDQHYLPVKLRYPVAKMRIMVEQSAARITER
jgi:hypothetical protein